MQIRCSCYRLGGYGLEIFYFGDVSLEQRWKFVNYLIESPRGVLGLMYGFQRFWQMEGQELILCILEDCAPEIEDKSVWHDNLLRLVQLGLYERECWNLSANI